MLNSDLIHQFRFIFSLIFLIRALSYYLSQLVKPLLQKKLLQQSSQWRTVGRRTLCNWTKGPQAAVHEHPLFYTRAHITQSMDYTFSLQLQHHLTVYPTHFCEDYSLELQVCFKKWSQSRGDERSSKLTLLSTLLEILVKHMSNITKPDISYSKMAWQCYTFSDFMTLSNAKRQF